jgi:hypothetical protein
MTDKKYMENESKLEYAYERAHMRAEKKAERRKMKIIDLSIVGDTLKNLKENKSKVEAVIWFINGDRINVTYGNSIPAAAYCEISKIAKSGYRNIPELAKVQTANRIIDLFHCA